MNSGIERSVIHDAELELPAVPEAAAAAREFLRETLHTYQLDGLGDVTVPTGAFVGHPVRITY